MMHTPQQLREHADLLERANVHEDLGLALSLSQAADLLRWAADRIETLTQPGAAAAERT